MARNNYNNQRQISTGKTAIRAVAVLLGVFAIAYIVISLVFGAWSPKKWMEVRQTQINGGTNINKPDTPDNPDNKDPDSGEIITGGAEVMDGENNGISITSALLPRSAYAANAIDPQSDSAYVVTATVAPDNADDKTIDWSISWKNVSSTWANGKTVTDYGTITPTADGALTANFVCKQAFGEQMVITATSRDNATAKGTTIVDYRKRLTSSTTGIFDGDTSTTKLWDTSVGLLTSSTTFNDVFSVGTLDDTVTSHTMTITTSSVLRSQLSSVFTSTSARNAYTATREYNGKNAYTDLGSLTWDALFDPGGVSSGFRTNEGLFSFCSDASDYGEYEINTAQFNKLRTCLNNSAIDFVITVKVELEHSADYTASYNVNVSENSLKIRVESVTTTGYIVV